MARMYPERLPHTVESYAEHALFRAFRDRTCDRRTVLAGVNWVYANERGQGRTAEADFVVLDPDRGMLVIEVKGGQVGHDARTGRWYSISRGGYDNTIKNPIEQARRAFYDLRDTLSASYGTARFEYPGGYGVAFIDGVVDSAQLPLEAPRAIVLDATDLDDLDRAIDRMFQHWTGRESAGPGVAGVQAAVDLLAKSWQVKTPLVLDLKRESEEIRTLTEGQYRLLDMLSMQTRALIRGCAGSGKTFLAAEKARRLANQSIPTLLTCYNKPLARWLRERFSPLPETLHIQHFHELAYETAKAAGLEADKPEDMDQTYYFNTYQPALLVEALQHVDTRFDAIVVDEGQDFREDWWLGLLELLRDPDEGIFYIFYDERQAIYNDEMSFPFDTPPYVLNENLRNTRAIHQHIAHFYEDGVVGAGPEGRPPVIIQADDPAAALGEQLHRLISEGGVNVSDIVVLTPLSEARSRWKTGQRVGRYTLTWQDPPVDRQVLVSTIHSFKGLERPVVILTEMDRYDTNHQLHLVACSRARHELVMISGLGT